MLISASETSRYFRITPTRTSALTWFAQRLAASRLLLNVLRPDLLVHLHLDDPVGTVSIDHDQIR